jgi:hypothetical protein
MDAYDLWGLSAFWSRKLVQVCRALSRDSQEKIRVVVFGLQGADLH